MEILTRQFGLLIAYLLPGFVALAGVTQIVPTVAGWLRADSSANFGAPLYALLAATAAGMVVSCFRWFLIDPLIVLSGVPQASFNAKALEVRLPSYSYLVENHYRYFQAYSNLLIAALWSYGVFRWLGRSSRLSFGTDIAVLVLCAVLFAGSRDAVRKYRQRTVQLIGPRAVDLEAGDPIMTNGIDHHQGGGKTAKKPPEPQSQNKPEKQVAPKDVQTKTKQANG